MLVGDNEHNIDEFGGFVEVAEVDMELSELAEFVGGVAGIIVCY